MVHLACSTASFGRDTSVAVFVSYRFGGGDIQQVKSSSHITNSDQSSDCFFRHSFFHIWDNGRDIGFLFSFIRCKHPIWALS